MQGTPLHLCRKRPEEPFPLPCPPHPALWVPAPPGAAKTTMQLLQSPRSPGLPIWETPGEAPLPGLTFI